MRPYYFFLSKEQFSEKNENDIGLLKNTGIGRPQAPTLQQLAGGMFIQTTESTTKLLDNPSQANHFCQNKFIMEWAWAINYIPNEPWLFSGANKISIHGDLQPADWKSSK